MLDTGKPTEAVAAGQEAVRLIMAMGVALHRCGAAAHHIEGALSALAAALMVRGQFFVTPTAIIGEMEQLDGERNLRLVRVRPQGIELDRLSSIDEIGDQIIRKEISISEALRRIDELDSQPKRPVMTMFQMLSFILATASFCAFLNGSLRETIISGLLGVMVWLWLRWTQPQAKMGEIAEPLAGFLMALVVSALTHVLVLRQEIVILSGLIVLIPGLSITIALSELSTKNLMAGTARLTGAITELLKLSFAVALGSQLVPSRRMELDPTDFMDFQLIDHLPSIFLVMGAGLAFAGLFQVRRRDFSWVILAAIISYYSTKWGGLWLGASLGVFVGGICLKSFSNAYARLLRRPALTVLFPGLIIMVPGSFGFRAFNLMFAKDLNQSIALGFELVIIAVALVAGLSLGQFLIHPRRNV
ncbi:MAG: threonine/serine ThrE exporter family protein [Oligoflexus sp.]